MWHNFKDLYVYLSILFSLWGEEKMSHADYELQTNWIWSEKPPLQGKSYIRKQFLTVTVAAVWAVPDSDRWRPRMSR